MATEYKLQYTGQEIDERLGAINIYFDITSEGVISLKPEYRGQPKFGTDKDYNLNEEFIQWGYSGEGFTKILNGTKYVAVCKPGHKNAGLPKSLIIPDTVGGIKVTKLAPYMFAGNRAIESLVLPSGITTIPKYCFQRTPNLHTISGTGNITEIEEHAFSMCAVRKIEFPELTSLGSSSFGSCVNLTSINIGKVTEIPEYTFNQCLELCKVFGGTGVTEIPVFAFYLTPKLTHLDCVGDNLKTVKAGAFIASGFNNWGTLLTDKNDDGTAKCVFEEYSISAQPDGSEPFWTSLSIKQRENPLPTFLHQGDDEWVYEPIAGSKKLYASGCMFMSFMHAYCGLYGLRLTHVKEFESILDASDSLPDSNILDSYSATGLRWIEENAPKLGLQVETYDIFDATSLQALYDSLTEGKYVVVPFPSHLELLSDDDENNDIKAFTGHAVLIHGIRADGKLVIADSAGDSLTSKDFGRYALTYQSFLHPTAIEEIYDGDNECGSFVILSLPKDNIPIYNGEATIDRNSDIENNYYSGEIEVWTNTDSSEETQTYNGEVEYYE